MSETESEHWEKLRDLVESSAPEEVEAFLDTLPPGETAHTVSRLSDEDQAKLLAKLDPDGAAGVLEQLPEPRAADLLESLAPPQAAAIVHELPSDEKADLLGEVEEQQAERILSELDPLEADEVRTLRAYAPDVAGGIMVTELLSYQEEDTVAQVIDDLRENAERYATYDVQYAYVTDAGARLTGVLKMRDLLLARPGVVTRELMIPRPLSIRDESSLDEIEDFFDAHDLFGVPVVDTEGRLLGVVHRADFEVSLARRRESDFRKAQGIVGGEELRSMPLALRCRRRLSWLGPNIILNVIAASVIAAYQDTLSQVIALAVFLPMISDMSGCSGNQAVGVSIRELTLGLVRPNEVFRVWLKEVTVGVINGLVLGTLLGGAAWLWQQNPYLGLVVGFALAINTVVAVSIGGVIPLLLRRWGLDPALSSAPILTTVTDMCGFFLVLGVASAMLERLV